MQALLSSGCLLSVIKIYWKVIFVLTYGQPANKFSIDKKGQRPIFQLKVPNKIMKKSKKHNYLEHFLFLSLKLE